MNDDDFSEDTENEDIIHVLSEENDGALVYGFYNQLTAHKEYFSSMQNRYRSLASTWILAGFFGIGFLQSSNNADSPINSFLGILLLCFCVSFGVALLWFLDIVLYQRLWWGAVVELARLENAHGWLPKVNLNTLTMKRNKKYRFFQSRFYIWINCVFLSIAFLFILEHIHNIYELALAFFTQLGIIYLIYKTMLYKSGELEIITIQSFR